MHWNASRPQQATLGCTALTHQQLGSHLGRWGLAALLLCSCLLHCLRQLLLHPAQHQQVSSTPHSTPHAEHKQQGETENGRAGAGTWRLGVRRAFTNQHDAALEIAQSLQSVQLLNMAGR